MSTTYPTQTVTTGVALPVDLPGSAGALAALRMVNLSLNTLKVTWMGGNTVIAPETRDIILFQVGNFDGHLDIMPVMDYTGITSSSSALYLIGYGPGEKIPGNDPAALTRSITGAVDVTNPQEVVNTTNASGSPVVLAYPVTNSSIGFGLNNDGTLTDTVLSKGASANAVSVTPGTGVLAANELFGDSGSSPSIAFFSGFLTGKLNSAVSSTDVVQLVDSNSGKVWGITIDNTGNLYVHDLTDSKVWTFSPAGLLTLPGGLTVNDTHILRPTGTHQVGYACGEGVATAGGQKFAYPCNHPMQGQSAATGATLTVASSANCTAAAVQFNARGFALELTSTAAGAFSWFGSYTTTGD